MRFGYELRHLQPSFPDGEDPDDYEELVEDFTGVADVVTNITPAEGVVNNVFHGP